jgi:hypothetical protein
MKVIIEPGKSGNVIATVAIGAEYYDPWEKYALPTWKKYCKRHELGLIVFVSDLIPQSDAFWKKPTWQTILIGKVLKDKFKNIENVCYLDTDIVINYMAPNIFDNFDPSTIGLISLRKNLPYSYESVLRRMAYLRHNLYDNKYPLDSALYISTEDLYRHHNLPVQEDEACCGVYIYNVNLFAEALNSVFYKYDKNVQSITNGGNQTHFNYEIQSLGKVSWLDYKFQAIWVFEMAWKFPFLYDFGRNNQELIRECIEASLSTNYFLHFAGHWHESEMWNIGGILEGVGAQDKLEGFADYMKLPVTGKPVGQIKP